jgi:hypothetical protein
MVAVGKNDAAGSVGADVPLLDGWIRCGSFIRTKNDTTPAPSHDFELQKQCRPKR